MSETTYDMSILTRLIGQMLGLALGNKSPGWNDMQSMLRTEAGHLAWEISNQRGPTTPAAGKKVLDNNIRGVFFPLNVGAAEGFSEKQGRSADMLWLFSYKMHGNSFLVGASPSDIVGNDSDLKSIYYNTPKSGKSRRGAIWKSLGHRGTQSVVRINRKVITPQAYVRFANSIKSKIGQLRASFAYTASMLTPKKRVPEFVQQQIQSCIKNGKGIFNEAGLDAEIPFLEFGSRAKGVVSNPMVAGKIQAAIKAREQIIQSNLKKLLLGYKYNFDTGQVYRHPEITEVEL